MKYTSQPSDICLKYTTIYPPSLSDVVTETGALSTPGGDLRLVVGKGSTIVWLLTITQPIHNAIKHKQMTWGDTI